MKESIRKALEALTQALEEDEVKDEQSLEEVVEEATETAEVEEVAVEQETTEELETVRTEVRTEKINKETGDGEITTKITFKDGQYYGI